MWTVIQRKGKSLAGNDGRKSPAVHAEPGETLRKGGFAAKPENKRTTCEGAAGHQEFSAHPRKS
jgi:hypothetical protein